MAHDANAFGQALASCGQESPDDEGLGVGRDRGELHAQGQAGRGHRRGRCGARREPQRGRVEGRAPGHGGHGIDPLRHAAREELGEALA